MRECARYISSALVIGIKMLMKIGLGQYLVDFFLGVMQSFLAVLSVFFICKVIFPERALSFKWIAA